MTTMTTQKPWDKPQLLVLVRNKPEEAILAACKTMGTGSSPMSDDTNCYGADGSKCYRCDADMTS